MGHVISIDGEACVGCGRCVSDCPFGNIGLAVSDGKKVAAARGQSCIMCGHCVAVCPRDAVSISGFDDKPVALDEKAADGASIASGNVLGHVRFARSVRAYKPDAIDPEALDRILEVGRLSPTAANAQRTSFLVIERDIRRVEALAVAFFRRLKRVWEVFVPRLRMFDVGDDFFFFGAPVAIVVMTGNKVDAGIAAANMAMEAQASGLGTLYSGFFTMCVNRSRTLRRALGLGRGERGAITLVLGSPAVRYRRSTQREAAKVRRL